MIKAALLLILTQGVSPAEPSASPDEAVLAAAVLGATLQLLTEEVRQTGAIACILLNRDGVAQPPDEAFLQQFKRLPFILSGAACESTPEGAVESATGAPAFLLTVGPVEWIAPDEGHVRVVYRREGSYSHRRLYRVVREPSGWISLGQIIEMSPA